jgi:serine/threonine protein kinase
MSSVVDRLRAALTSYELEREIGRGGMATVYLARDRKHHRNVAVKVLRPELASAIGPDRFQREILTVAGLTHPHILPLHDSGESDGFLYYVMPYVEGESLRDRLEREQQLPLEDALRITGEVADALDYAHSHGIVHRDIKPENILFEAGHAVVTDFGIARVMASSEVDSFTGPGAAVGTVAYMSPEQAAGSKVLDGRSDQYALGCVLYEMLAGDPPFTASSAQALIARKLNDSLPRITIVRPTVPPHVEAAINRATHRVAADRFRSMGELAEALRRPPPPPPTVEEKPMARPERQRRMLKLGMVALLALGVGYLGWKAAARVIDAVTRPNYPEVPSWTAWRGWIGEYFPVFAVSDSILIARALGSNTVQVYDGQRWTAVPLPDSIELLPYDGQLSHQHLLGAQSILGPSGDPLLQYWWLEVSAAGIRRIEPVSTPVPDNLIRPLWWSDGKDLALFQEAITRPDSTGWIREPTGTTGGIAALWGRDLGHRYAISAARDSLLVFDGLNWRNVEIPAPRSTAAPEFAAGTTLRDETTVVVGEECAATQCQPLLLEQGGTTGPWRRLTWRRGLGIPTAVSNSSGCEPARFSFGGVAGRDRSEYFIWGSWTTCETGPLRRDVIGCPRDYPCFWRVRDDRIEVVPDFLGRIVQALVYRDSTAYALLDDGTLWRQEGEQWRIATQAPGLPTRRVGASERVIVWQTDRDLRYEPGQSDPDAPFLILPLTRPGRPHDPGLGDLVVRDSNLAVLGDDGSVLVSRCSHQTRISTGTGSSMSPLLCPDLVMIPRLPGRVDAIGILADGRVVGVGASGFAFSWRSGTADIEVLPPAARNDRLWGLAVSDSDQVFAVGRSMVVGRDRAGTWSIVRTMLTSGAAHSWFLAMPNGDFVVSDPSLQSWDHEADSLPAAILYRPALGEAQIGAVHALKDGRLVAGLANPLDPTLGGWLLVWSAPARDNQSRRVTLPINLDITDLADDGYYLYVVGQGGSLKIPLDSLPYATRPSPN